MVLDKHFNFHRQFVSISGKSVPIHWFSRTSCRLIAGSLFRMSTFLSNVFPYQGESNPLEWSPQTVCHHIRGTCSTWKDSHRQSFSPFWLLFRKITAGFLEGRDWLTAFCMGGISFMTGLSNYGLMVFPFLVWMFWVTLATYFLPLILQHCYSQFAAIFASISD